MTITTETVYDKHLSINFTTRVVDYFHFLKSLHDYGVTQNVSSSSLKRYQLWLDQLGEHEPSDLLPPPDVAWLWHCHRLVPRSYHAYMKESIPSENWKSQPSGDPYQLSQDGLSNFLKEEVPATASHASASETLAHEFGALLSSAKRQAEFYWQVQPYFTAEGEPKFDTELALKEYFQFLNLMKENSGQTLVPTYLIDLYWHTHMTGGSVEDYALDCERICKRLIDHSDDYCKGDRDGLQGADFEVTAKLWEQTYGDPTYKRKGGYRGPPHEDYYRKPVASNVTRTVQAGTSPMPQTDQAFQTSGDANPVSKLTWKRGLCMLCAMSMIIGTTLFILSDQIASVEYACEGIVPPLAELEYRRVNSSAPVCLTTSVRDEAMCLQAGTPSTQPPRYCQTNLAKKQENGHRDWYLWWSPCTECGKAWHMDPVVGRGNSSLYKLPTDDPVGIPFGALSWQKRISFKSEERLNVSSVSIEECDATVSEEYDIPSACFVPKRVQSLGIAGIVLLSLPLATLVLVFLGAYAAVVYDEFVHGRSKVSCN